MYFDFDDHRPDIAPIGREISSRREIRVFSIGPLSLHVAMGWQPSQIFAAVATPILYVVMLSVMVLAPQLFPPDADADRARLELLNLQRERQDQGRFVFVQPRLDPTAPKPPNVVDLSDKDREARAPERAEDPANALPFARGNTPERVEQPEEQPARGEGPAPDPAAGQRTDPESQSALQSPIPQPPSPIGSGGASSTPGGSLGDSVRNPQRFTQSESFDNQRGGANEFGDAIQFDTKGVEFGPWVRRFVAQVKRNWFVPNAAMMGLKGRVVITFNVHKSGAITDLTIIGPCPIEAFNKAALGALVSSNPTQPLPPEYPSEKAFFTVTFFYNESQQ